jgi:dTDP-4-dehydrorhamnose 3,5-epimerase-like enzyme
MTKEPHIIEFPKIGSSEIGYLSFAEYEKHLPFKMKRIFWTYFTPEKIVRGRHAHHKTEMILIALAGRIILNTEMLDGQRDSFVLESPHQGVYMPAFCWHTMQYSHTAVQLVITNSEYQAEDYIRSYDDFLALRSKT